MTQRDQKTVVILILGLVGIGAAFLFVQSWFLSPLAEYNTQIKGLQADVDGENQQIAGIMRDRKLLDNARTLSLPVNRVQASAKYDEYLVTLLTKSGLTEVDVQGPPPADLKAAVVGSAIQNAVKKPGHTVLTYQVRAKGNLAAVVTALENLQRTPVQHRIKGLTLGRRENSAKDVNKDNLVVQMAVEAMIVAGTKPGFEPSLRPDSSMALPSENNQRRYSDIARKNIFTGPVPQAAKASSTEITEEEEIIPGFVVLVSTEPTSQEAFLRTRIFQMPETRLRSKPGSGYDTFRIMNEDRTKVLVKAKVLRVDQRDVYFQVRDDVYGLHIGHTIADAMKLPLSEGEVKRLDLTGLVQEYDPNSDKDSSKKAGRSAKGR